MGAGLRKKIILKETNNSYIHISIVFKFIFIHKATRLHLRYTLNNNICHEVKWAVYSVKFKFKHFTHP